MVQASLTPATTMWRKGVQVDTSPNSPKNGRFGEEELSFKEIPIIVYCPVKCRIKPMIMMAASTVRMILMAL